jgi:predicted nucleotidyltransferase component of viral defense system
VESVEKIGSEKIRSLVERKKCRDYCDVWQLMKLKLNWSKLKKLLGRKFAYKGLSITSLEQIFPADLPDTLKGYWDRELGRLIYPVPEMGMVIDELKEDLRRIV